MGSYCANAIKMLKINLHVSSLCVITTPRGMRISKPSLTPPIVSMCVIKRYGVNWDTSAFHANRNVATVSCIIMNYLRNQGPYSNILFKKVYMVTIKGERGKWRRTAETELQVLNHNSGASRTACQGTTEMEKSC